MTDLPDTPPTVPRQAQRTFIFTCLDAAGTSALRTEHLDGHLAHVEANWTRYVVAGPIREPGATALSGSVFIVYADDEEAAWDLMRGDPYVTSGLYQTISCHDLTLSIGRYPGGKIWESADAIRSRATGG